MKKFFLATMIAVCSHFAFALDPGVDEKVLEAFNRTFPNVEDVVWTQTANSYEVKFKQDVISSRVTYDKQGNVIKTLRYYFEEQLPIIITSKVKSKFSDKKIYGVTEEASDNGIFFHITLEDEKSWTQIKVDTYGSITVENKFQKG